jgi:hypothetical protein
MRPFVVAPAHVHAEPVRRNPPHGGIESLNVEFCFAEEFVIAGPRELHLATHAQIRAIELKDEPSLHDRLVLGSKSTSAER